MNNITHTQRCLPHTLDTKIGAVKLYRSGHNVDFVCRRYHISKSSLMRWNKRYDDTRNSLKDHSHRPHSPHPNAHTEKEIKWIQNLYRRNPHICISEVYGKLLKKGYRRHPGSLYRVFRRLGYTSSAPSTKKKRPPKKYDTPKQIGIKWQLDVKYVLKACYVGEMPDRFYQYTVIDEASRERYIYAYKEQSSYSTCDFIKRAIRCFGYIPKQIQTDNGSEFAYTGETNRIPMAVLGWKSPIQKRKELCSAAKASSF